MSITEKALMAAREDGMWFGLTFGCVFGWMTAILFFCCNK